ncbi:MAG TPA: hypothetical protein ENH82_02585 [bacterium]|nr:hypothetical protein [bacterium]
MKRARPKQKPNPYDDLRYKMPWGKYAGKRIKRIPAQYFLELEREGWALPDMIDWINRNREELEARANEENESGYTVKYDLKNAYT